MWRRLAVVGAVVCWVAAGGHVAWAVDGGTLVMFGFENSLDDWELPSWARESADYVGQSIAVSEDYVNEGRSSLQLLTNFPGERWTGAYVERLMFVTNWAPYAKVAVDVYVPFTAPRGLKARLILTVGEQWTWTEMNRAIALEPGKWTTIAADLTEKSMDWKFFPPEGFRQDIRKLGIRVESDHQPVYVGPVYIDNVRLLK